MYRKLSFVFIFVLVHQGVAFSQVFPNLGGQRAGISSFTFLKNDLSPRSVGMGGFNVSNTGGAYATAVNPAAITDVNAYSLALSNYFLINGVSQSYLTGIVPTKGDGTWGFSVNSLNSGKQEVRTEFQPEGTGEYFYATNMAIGVSYGRKLSNRFSLGGTLKYVYEQLAEFYDHAATVDLGFLYRTDYKDLQFAVALQNFGSNSSLFGTASDYQVSYNRTDPSLAKSASATLFKFGASFKPYKTEKQGLLVGLQVNHPNDNSESIRLGLEYDYRNFFFARAGFKLNVKGERMPCFGLGVRTLVANLPLGFDYGVNPTDYLGLQHNVGLFIMINKESREEE